MKTLLSWFPSTALYILFLPWQTPLGAASSFCEADSDFEVSGYRATIKDWGKPLIMTGDPEFIIPDKALKETENKCTKTRTQVDKEIEECIATQRNSCKKSFRVGETHYHGYVEVNGPARFTCNDMREYEPYNEINYALEDGASCYESDNTSFFPFAASPKVDGTFDYMACVSLYAKKEYSCGDEEESNSELNTDPSLNQAPDSTMHSGTDADVTINE